MPIPDFQTIMRPLLAQLSDGDTHSLSQLHDEICREFELSPEEVKQRINSGKQTVMRNRVGWARTYLSKAGLIAIPARGLAAITERGRQVLQECPERVDVKYLKRYEEFREFYSPKVPGKAAETEVETADEESTPEERLEAAHKALTKSLADDLLSVICSASPTFFEQLVVDLMLAMGYGGSRKEAGRATQYTSDGGIDGIIKDDPLGLENIYLQAKRYTDATVGRPEVQSFAGALDMQRAKKGVFITTSRFSRDAMEYVELIEKRIVLIDGPQLAELMIEHNLGVTPKEVYEVKQIDSDYFSEDN